MGDLSDKGSECDDIMNCKSNSLERGDGSLSSDGGNVNQHIKTCADCGTSKTPLWRGGPAGPKSLCNACGIRSRKKRRLLLGMSKDDKKLKKTTTTTTSSSSSGGDDSQTSGLTTITKGINTGIHDFCLKRRLMALGSEVVFQRPRSRITKPRRKIIGEEEQAAILLMALSCGSVFA